MKMIVGLGNPGTKYEKTKHNVGFMVIDELAKKHQVTFKKNAFQALVGEYFENGEKILLVKPQTFMNESGKAVGPLMTYFNIYPEELVIVYDEMTLEEIDIWRLLCRYSNYDTDVAGYTINQLVVN